jgi:hypothetical protein
MLNELTKQLDSAVQQIGGIDAAIEACDRMYSATFRGETAKLSAFDDWEEEIYSLYLEVATALFITATGETQPQREDVLCGCAYDCDCSLDSWGYASEAFDERAEDWMGRNFPDFKINESTMVVGHCNYKGEGERGLYIYELSKSLPVFKSKSESWNQVN